MESEPGFSGCMSIDRPSSPLSSRSSTPFQFPFPPLALFDSDTSSRLLTLLQHQNLLTEESLRSKSLFGDTRSLYLLTKDGFRFNHLFADDLMNRKPLLPDTIVRNRTPEEDVRPNLLSQENTEDRNKSGEETVRCSICSAFFPSAWLLEQHTALQHLPLGQLPDDKPFICDQCGQSYRYRSAYVKHREQNHRARLPADKLFTCDVCGMQFRYLKSFKKHRLNHALERLHGKSDMFFANDRPENSNSRMFMMMRPDLSSKSSATVQTITENSNDQVSSSNEAIPLSNNEIDLTVSKVKEEVEPNAEENIDNPETKKSQLSDCDQDDTIDSMSYVNPTDASTKTDQTLTEKDPSVSFPNADSSISEGSSAETTILRKILRPDLDRKIGTNFSHVSVDSSNIDFRKQETFVASLLNADSSILSETMRASQESIRNLNAQEASILNFLRVDAVERQRERRFACPFCGKCVRSKENLKLHVRKHTGERPFVCLFCGRAFGGKSDLTRHLRIHTGERPYHCEACGKCFARADYLSKHLTTHIHNTSR